MLFALLIIQLTPNAAVTSSIYNWIFPRFLDFVCLFTGCFSCYLRVLLSPRLSTSPAYDVIGSYTYP